MTLFGITRGRAATILAVLMALFHLYTAGVRLYPAMQQRSAHLVFALALAFLMYPIRPDTRGQPRLYFLLDLLLVFLSFFIGGYVMLDYEGIAARAGWPSVLDSLVSLIAVILVIEATRRVMGMAMCIIIFVSLAYVVFGMHLPAVLAHSGYKFSRIVNHMFLSTEGILGVALATSATVIIVFLIFGAFLEHSGATASLTSIGLGLFGRFRAGAAKAAVLASCLFGMMTGSQTANVAAIGTFTIPLMVRSGYKPMMAGAIEALASTGSMLTPPVMGAAAFIIPEIIGGTYVDVMRAAIFPSLLYYVAVFVFIQVQASKLGLAKLYKSELPEGPSFKETGHLFIPILVMLYLLIFQGASTRKAGFWAVIAVVLVSMFRKGTRMGPAKVLLSLETGAKNTLAVAIACASAGIIEGVLSLTGMGLRFSEALIYLAGGNTLVLLILTMIASLIIGLPLPPVTAYLILAILAAPALVKTGVDPMAAHLFILFFGVLGNITPPSAPCSFAAAAIARTDPLKTTNLTFLISAPTFLIPYLFVYAPELMVKGPAVYTVYKIGTSFVALAGIAMGFLGYSAGTLGVIGRLAMVGGSLLLVPHSIIANALGYVIIAVVLCRRKIWRACR